MAVKSFIILGPGDCRHDLQRVQPRPRQVAHRSHRRLLGLQLPRRGGHVHVSLQPAVGGARIFFRIQGWVL
jgi:hypothetical protein